MLLIVTVVGRTSGRYLLFKDVINIRLTDDGVVALTHDDDSVTHLNASEFKYDIEVAYET